MIRAVNVLFAVLLVALRVCAATPMEQFSRELAQVKAPVEAKPIVVKYRSEWIGLPSVKDPCARLLTKPSLADLDEVRYAVKAAVLGAKSYGTSRPLAENAAAIKRQLEIEDKPQTQSDNWIARSFDRIGKAISEFMDFACRRRRRTAPEMNLPEAPEVNTDWLSNLAYFVLCIAVAVGVYFAARQFGWKMTRNKRVAAILDDDEPERTADEWLVNAAALEAQGKFREAVRSLYIASLVKFDEFGVARFIRGQTNWEHFDRIHASPRRPLEIDFREPTRRFDRVWYGFKVDGATDVQYFREVYNAVCQALKTVA